MTRKEFPSERRAREERELDADVDKMQTDLAYAREAVGFFASVIKSGEPWTSTCQQALDRAMGRPA